MPKKIKPSIFLNNKALIKESTIPEKDKKIVFSFSDFLKESIVCGDFNNKYANKIDSINAVKDFFNSLKDISTLTISQLSSSSYKGKFHYNELNREDVIKRINKILIKGYNLPEQFVKNDLESTYFEFEFKDGKRAICTKTEENVISILFLDPNHLVCIDSSRLVKEKQKYAIPSTFEGWKRTSVDNLNINAKDFLQEYINEYEKDMDKDRFIINIKDVLYMLQELC